MILTRVSSISFSFPSSTFLTQSRLILRLQVKEGA